MNIKLPSEEKAKQSQVRRPRHQTRNSPNSKLLNAAWPKAPTVPTRQSHIKAVNHSEFQQSWSKWKQQVGNTTLGESIEDMEIDEDCQANKKQVDTASKDEKKASNNHTLTRPAIRGSRRNQRKTEETHKEKSSSSIITSEDCEVSSTSDLHVAIKKKTPQKAKDALFIIIHVSQVEVGVIKGPATAPVKVFADKFMVQMENEVTKKDLSFRVPCKNILSLHVSLDEKPFWIKFRASNINYVNNGSTAKSRRSKGGVVIEEEVVLRLCYEEAVPISIKDDLQELFEVRLAELNLWPQVDRENTGNAESATPNDIALSTKTPNSKLSVKTTSHATASVTKAQTSNVRGAAKSSKAIEVSKRSDRGNNTQSSKVYDGSHVDESKNQDEAIPTDVISTRSHRSSSISCQLPSTLPSVRKRIPRSEDINIRKKDTEDIEASGQVKIAKRSHNEITESLEERVKTLTHEAAHYQMLSAQQRMIMQSLEDDVRSNTSKYENQLEYLRNELVNRQRTSESNEDDKDDLNELLHNEREVTDVLRNEVEELVKGVDEKEQQIVVSAEALRLRDHTIQQLRSELRDEFNKNNSSTETSCKSRKNKTEETTVPLSVMEETRQNLMQMQVSKESLTQELEQTKAELDMNTRQVNTLNQQIVMKERELTSKDEQMVSMASNLSQAQRELVTKSQLIESLNTQLNTARNSRFDREQINDELNSLRAQLGDKHVEIDDLKTQINEYQQILKQPRDENTPNDWIVERGEVELTNKIIGVGAWGNVKAGRFRGTEVAVKQIHLLILSPHNRRLFEREMVIASRCRHPCLVQFIGATNDDGTPLFVMELLENDLRSLLTKQPLESYDNVQIAYDIIRALSYLHLSKPVPIIHRDISSSNVLLYHGEHGWRGKLSDYGAANFVRISMTRHPGALLYSAPEASTIDQTPKLDVYSFGVLFCEMCTRELPVPENRIEQIRNVGNTEYRNLINNCLRRDIDKRLDSRAVADVIQSWVMSELEIKQSTVI